MIEELLREVRSAGVEELRVVLEEVEGLLEKQQPLTKLPEEPVVVVGDLHGDLSFFENFVLRANERLVFLGDYADRGEEQFEVYYVVLRLKQELKERVVLLRGNHEFPPWLPVSPHDLPYALARRLGRNSFEIYEALKRLWSRLGIAAVVESFLCLHGGIPHELKSLKELAEPSPEILEEVLWNDPFSGEGVLPSPRGAGFLFGRDVSEGVLRDLGFEALIRAHQACEGFKLDHEAKVITVFSCKRPYGLSKAAYLRFDPKEARDIEAVQGGVVYF